MTIKQFAEEIGITPQAVYKRLKTSGIDVDSLKIENSNELTEDGLNRLQMMFTKTDKQTTEQTLVELETEIQKLRERVDELTKERDEWKVMAQQALITAQQALKALPQPTTEKKTSVWGRIFGRKSDS